APTPTNRGEGARRGRLEAKRKPRSPMPAQCCRGKTARLNAGNSRSGYASFAKRPGSLGPPRLEHFGEKSPIRLQPRRGYGRGSPDRNCSRPTTASIRRGLQHPSAVRAIFSHTHRGWGPIGAAGAKADTTNLSITLPIPFD